MGKTNTRGNKMKISLNTIKKILLLSALTLIFSGAWQLDLLAAPAFWNWENWSAEYQSKIYYLPFNIPMDKQLAYCMFWVWIFIGIFLILLAFWILPYAGETIQSYWLKKQIGRNRK